MKIKSITPIEPEEAMCIEVDDPSRLFAVGGESGQEVLTHNSVVQRNIIFSTILRPESWAFLGIDLKKVELSAYRAYSNVVLGIATELEDALTVLRFAQQTMMKRYSEMEQLGINNFLDLPVDANGGGKSKALLVMVDELGELASQSGGKALSENTLIPTPHGFTTMGELKIGDEVLDIYEKPTTVTNKYQPEDQTQYSLTISKDQPATDTKCTESFIAGEEHLWVAIIENPDGTKNPEQIMETGELYEFKKEQEKLPAHLRSTIKFRRYSA